MTLWLPSCPPIKIGRDWEVKPNPNPTSQTVRLCSSIKTRLNFTSSFQCYCSKNQISEEEHSQEFCGLPSDIPWEKGSLWSTIAVYMLCLHIPLGVGGLSIASYALRRPHLDPQSQAFSLVVFQILEFAGALILLKTTAKEKYDFTRFFKTDKFVQHRSWPLASILSFGFLVLLVFSTSVVADKLVGDEVVNNSAVKEILLGSDISRVACVLVYCVITPLLEETVYRGFLLTSLASSSNWPLAILLSSATFSAAHFSAENFLQLFIIGCVLGCCYSWMGNLSSSIVVHSLYNALILIITFVS